MDRGIKNQLARRLTRLLGLEHAGVSSGAGPGWVLEEVGYAANSLSVGLRLPQVYCAEELDDDHLVLVVEDVETAPRRGTANATATPPNCWAG